MSGVIFKPKIEVRPLRPPPRLIPPLSPCQSVRQNKQPGVGGDFKTDVNDIAASRSSLGVRKGIKKIIIKIEKRYNAEVPLMTDFKKKCDLNLFLN